MGEVDCGDGWAAGGRLKLSTGPFGVAISPRTTIHGHLANTGVKMRPIPPI